MILDLDTMTLLKSIVILLSTLIQLAKQANNDEEFSTRNCANRLDLNDKRIESESGQQQSIEALIWSVSSIFKKKTWST